MNGKSIVIPLEQFGEIPRHVRYHNISIIKLHLLTANILINLPRDKEHYHIEFTLKGTRSKQFSRPLLIVIFASYYATGLQIDHFTTLPLEHDIYLLMWR